MKALLTGVVYCAECKRPLTLKFTSTGRLVLDHERDSKCAQAGKTFEPPSVTLKEAKK